MDGAGGGHTDEDKEREIAYGEIWLRPLPLATHRDTLMRISIKLDNTNNNQSQGPAVPR